MTDILERLRSMANNARRIDTLDGNRGTWTEIGASLDEAADEIERLRADLLTRDGEAQDLQGEVARLCGLLREASGPMSYGRWSTVFRHEVKEALGDE